MTGKDAPKWCGFSEDIPDRSQGSTGFSEGQRTCFLNITQPEGISMMEIPQIICNI